MKEFLKRNIVYIAWLQSIVATLGSLYFSQVRHFTPCVLCWYQRICMYPMVILIGVGILRKDTKVYQYVLPITFIGMAISIYHNLLYYGVIPEKLAPCMVGASCTTKFIDWAGFITIPLLSLTALTVITICMLVYRSIQKNEQGS